MPQRTRMDAAPRSAARRKLVERLLSERSKTGESYRALSERSGIPAPTLAWWEHRRRASGGDKGGIELIELDFEVGPEKPESWIEIQVPGGAVVRLPANASVELLRRVFEAAGSGC